MTDALSTELERASAPKDTKTVLDLIELMKPELEKSLQSVGAAEILIRHYYSAIRYNELLRQCTAESLIAALLLSAQVRLEPGPLGHVYLVPYKNAKKQAHEVVWIVGYTGIIELARRGGAQALRSTVVWDVDDYTPPWENEKGVHFQLKPGPQDARKERVGVLVTWKDAGIVQALHVPPERVERAQKASAAYKAKSGPWFTDEDAMWRKTGVRAARPFLPLATELAQASAADGHTMVALDVADGEAVPVLEGGDEA